MKNHFKINEIVKKISFLFILFLFFFSIISISGQSELYWATDLIDSSGDVGTYCSMVNDGAHFHVSYYDSSNKDLKYAFYDGSSWDVETVDSDGNVGLYTSISVDSNDDVHISYYDSSNGNLNYAFYDGSWTTETVDNTGDVGKYSSLALDGTNPCISYYDETNGNLNYAFYDGSWTIETVDNTGDVGKYSSLALDGTNPCISYFNSSNNTLKYAKKTAGNWNNQTIDTSNGYSSLRIDGSTPHIVYYTKNNHLNYTTYSGSWSFDTIDPTGNVGTDCSLVLDNSDLHVSYYDASNQDLKYAVHDGSWTSETIVSTGSIGRYCSLSVESSNPYFVCYDDSNNDCVFISEKDADPPSEPYNLNGATYQHSVSLQWNAPNETGGAPIINYYIYRYKDSSTFEKIDTIGNTTQYTDNTVENGDTYSYQVSAVNAVGESSSSNIISLTTPIVPPLHPLGFDVEAEDGYVLITWNPPANDGGSTITRYKLYKGTSDNSLSLLDGSIDNTTFTYNDTSVNNGKEYFYQLSAVNEEGEGDKTSIRSDTPEGTPDEPNDLQATFFNNSIILTWDQPDSDGGSEVIEYQLYRGTSTSSLSLLTKISSNAERTYTDDSIESNQAYYYAITARNIHGESPRSNIIEVTEPDSPDGFSAIGHDEYVSLSWSKPNNHNAEITGYTLYRGSSSSNINYFTDISKNSRSYTDNSVENGVTYYYKITAVNAIGESVKSSWEKATPMGLSSEPTDLSLSFQGGVFQSSSVHLEWNAPIDDGGASLESYIIYRGISESSLEEYVTISTSSHSFTDKDVNNGNTYFYRISAVNQVGESSKTTVQSVEVPSFLIYYVFMVAAILAVLIFVWIKIPLIKAYFQHNKINQRYESFANKDNSLITEDIKELLSKKDPQSILKAEELLNKREKKYEKFTKMKEELKDINMKIEALAKRLSNGELTNDAFTRARENLEREKKEIEENFWKLRNELFKDEYEKPF